MRHDLTLTGHAFRLRPITESDASLILELRGNPKLNRYLHATSDSLDDQLTWLTLYFERPGDYYFVIERCSSGTEEGLVSIYDINLESGYAEWGRWILKAGSLAAVESSWLIYHCAFEHLGLKSVFCRTVANNTSVISFHDSCGIVSKRLLPNHFSLNGELVDAIEHHVDYQSWPAINLRLKKLAQLIARRLPHG